ncbi:MAG: branched-chain amino acid ABC transporter permease [Rubrivivax sp.]|nr:branched-chain amino acid ABC transporter permease [Rubrivivax sp.]
MFFRQAGIHHSTYRDDRQLFPIPFDRWQIAVLLMLAVAAPLLLSPLHMKSYMLPWLIWTAAALGLNLVLGWAGQFHFGYAAIMGIGAYTAVHATLNRIPFEIAVLMAGGMATLIGSAFAITALRVRGLYLALSTLAMQFVMDWVINKVPAVSGGTQATIQAPPMRLLGMEVTSDAGLYYVALVWCVLVTVFMLNLRRSGLGRALVAVREKDFAAAVIGVNSFYYKLVAFAMSSFIGGVTGAILVFAFYRAVTPELFAVNVSIQVLAMVIVGGLGSIIGCYFGVAFILLLPGIVSNLIFAAANAADLKIGIELLAHIPAFLYGVMIIGFLLFEPLGLAKIYSNLRNYFIFWPFGYARR